MNKVTRQKGRLSGGSQGTENQSDLLQAYTTINDCSVLMGREESLISPSAVPRREVWVEDDDLSIIFGGWVGWGVGVGELCVLV